MVALTGCGSNKGKLATEKEINAFVKEHKMSDVLKKEINFTFSYEYKSKEKIGLNEYNEKTTVDGRALFNYKKGDFQLYCKGKIQEKSTEYNNVKEKSINSIISISLIEKEV